ncbi:MAG TPA: glutamate--cysteine ligase [Actinophytocola sp.]|uniref:carboxylate-amine ligase n=1 Tax=Actinophytocola sp. TaxID=1872138 RepID=UPI002E06B260|nr:glutamate--cysteine ligase [Actinophytocola sp.]
MVASALSVGVEEEFMLVHPSAAHLRPCGPAVIEAAGRMGVRLYKELTTAQVETNTPVCWNIRDLSRELRELRSVAAAAATGAGARLIAAGATVAGDPTTSLADSARYRRMAEEFGLLVAEHGICGCHVHVGVADRETAVQVGNHLRPWLPTLLALTANSAVHSGRDTGYASWRSILQSRWPCSGPPPYFTSADHYDSVVAMMLDAGAALDHGMVYWDVRPSAHMPTIEIRVSDIPSTVDQTVLLAGLVRGLVGTAIRALDSGRTAAAVSAEVLRAAYWRSARDGLRGTAVDPFTLRRTTLPALLAALLRHIGAELEDRGELHEVTSLAGKVLSLGNGAIHQRRALSRRGAVADVVDQAARATVDDLGVPPGAMTPHPHRPQ